MPENLFINNYAAGWCPSDDIVNGRPNALLQMDNVELDVNGSITLTGGTSVKESGYSANAHTLYSKFLSGARHDYAACADGSIYRDNTQLYASGGDGSNAAFGTAFNFTLICSGNKRVKDSGSGTPVSLGVQTPTVAPLNYGGILPNPFAEVGSMINGDIVTVSGSSSVITSTTYGSGHARPASIRYLQGTVDVTTGQYVVQSYNDPGFPFNLNVLVGGINGDGNATDIDYIPFYGYIVNPFGVSFQFDVLLTAGNSAGDQVLDYYSYKIDDLSTLQFDANTGVFVINMQRSDFVRVGSAAGAGWNSVNGFRITVKGVSGQIINLLGNTPNPAIGDTVNMLGGSNAMFGVYQFAQVNVNNTGSYLALSGLGPATVAIIMDGSQYSVLAQTPTDPQVTEVWIMARSTGAANDLGQASQLNAWYQVLVIPIATVGSPNLVSQGDSFTLALDITFNTNLISIASTGITDKIYDLIGPIEGRWYYFTTNFMYPSDINNPDLVDTSLAVRTCGSASELFMWARAISASVVLVGTSIDIYLLTGTFTTLPDGSVDIYYQKLGVTQHPPITYDAVADSGVVYYLSNDGWRTTVATSFGSTYSSQNNSLIVAPNTDRLYRGESCYGYIAPNLKISPGSVRFPVTINRNKLWCFITGTSRCEVYDFQRQYWRTVNYGLGDATAAVNTQDGQTLVFYGLDKKLREIGILSSKLIDGATRQSFNISFTYKDNGKPRQRKDTYTLKSRCFTGTGSISAVITDENNNVVNVSGSLISATGVTEQYLDLSQQYQVILPKSYQIKLTGSASDLTVEDISIDYDPRPVPLSFVKIQPSNFGIPSKKRIRTWPVVIDTRGQNVLCTPSVDNINQTITTFNSSYKETEYYFFVTDVFGVDYGMTLYDPSGLMEIWEIGTPDIVQQLPIPRRFDQIGPQEFERYGKLVQIELRVLPIGGTSIPFIIYFSDSSVWNGVFTVVDGVEDSYYLDVPKGTSGRILRVVLGPTGFNFHRYYMKFRVGQQSGQANTELMWITIPGGMQ